jgi:hypothetical protein
LSRDEREEAIAKELMHGNFPNFLRKFKRVTIADDKHTAVIEVMPDYLAIGSDEDFVRVPMSPLTAQRIADEFGCCLPTAKIVNETYRAASSKLLPIPLTEAREAIETFVKHNEMIEKQREKGSFVAGIKKDVVVTNRLTEKPNRVAIYGWHKLDGTPIQPLTIVHVNWYVDYSHGIRLMKRQVEVDGKPRDARAVMQSAQFNSLLSDEGPILRPSY